MYLMSIILPYCKCSLALVSIPKFVSNGLLQAYFGWTKSQGFFNIFGSVRFGDIIIPKHNRTVFILVSPAVLNQIPPPPA